MCVNATRVQDDEIDPIGRCFVHPVDEFMFGIALKTAQLVSDCFTGELNTACFDVGEARGAIDLGLT